VLRTLTWYRLTHPSGLEAVPVLHQNARRDPRRQGISGTTDIAITGQWRENKQLARSPPLTALRLGTAAIPYAVLYLAAGMAVFPFVKEFYCDEDPAPLSTILGLQLVRGSLYVLYAWLWLRLIPRNTGLALGMVYAILGGIAPLLADGNPYMPREVRMPHLIEVGGSNFLFGLAAGRLVSPANAPDQV
jgi:hypothetical protein